MHSLFISFHSVFSFFLRWVSGPVDTLQMMLAQLESRHFGSRAELPPKRRDAPVFQCSCMLSSVLIGCDVELGVASSEPDDPLPTMTVVPCKSLSAIEQIATLAGSSHPLFGGCAAQVMDFALHLQAQDGACRGVAWKHRNSVRIQIQIHDFLIFCADLLHRKGSSSHFWLWWSMPFALPRKLVIQTEQLYSIIFEQSSSCPRQTERIEFVPRGVLQTQSISFSYVSWNLLSHKELAEKAVRGGTGCLNPYLQVKTQRRSPMSFDIDKLQHFRYKIQTHSSQCKLRFPLSTCDLQWSYKDT